MNENYDKVLEFWFNELTPKDWYKKDQDLDSEISRRFKSLLFQARDGELFSWRKNPEGSLAEIIVLDQFSRNIFRDLPQAFQQDPLALCLAQTAIDKNFDEDLNPIKKGFLYLPFMHSESKIIQEQSIEFFKAPGLEKNLNYAYAHKKIIDDFGRYPHRNDILNRTSTAEELEYLSKPGAGF